MVPPIVSSTANGADASAGRIYDLAVIGGGINGCGIARDAAGRGLSVFLAEKGDLAGGTSSASTKLIHGGLRYLEHFEFSLVREALAEREVLWALAPQLIRPMRFVLPHREDLRSYWKVRLGLLLYDNLGGRRRLARSRGLNLKRAAAGGPLRDEFARGFTYSDCWVDDARLVVLNAVDAAQMGADVRVRTLVDKTERLDDRWRLHLVDANTGERETVAARALVNAAGPWVSEVTTERIGARRLIKTRLVKGSHIVVKKAFDGDFAYIFQHPDKRVVFAIPYEDDFTLIGTTEIETDTDPDNVTMDDAEKDYLLDAVNAYFATPVKAADIVWSFAGVRPLIEDGDKPAQEVTRDYVLDLRGGDGGPVLLNVFGGKITTFRRLAEEALSMLRGALPKMGRPWTRGTALPGGIFPIDRLDALIADLAARYPRLDNRLTARMGRAYGTLAFKILGDAESTADLGRNFGAGLYMREVEHLMQTEWATTAEDILWRRSKLGLRMTEKQTEKLAQWLEKSQAKRIKRAAE